MASEIKLADALREDISDAIVALFGTGAKIKFYTASKPAGPGTAITSQTLLGTCTIAGAFGTYSAGVLTLGAVTGDSSADATGTAAWARLTTSADTALMDVTVGTSGADINLNTVSIVALGPIEITSAALTMPGG